MYSVVNAKNKKFGRDAQQNNTNQGKTKLPQDENLREFFNVFQLICALKYFALLYCYIVKTANRG